MKRSIDGMRQGSRPPLQSLPPSPPPLAPRERSTSTVPLVDISDKTEPAPDPKQPKTRRRSGVFWVLGGILVLIIISVAAAYGWYRYELTPVDGHRTTKQTIEIKSGMTPRAIGDMLAQKQVIRSSTVFYIYLRQTGQRDRLQAGSYALSPSQSTQAIVKALTGGATDTFSVTFFPGGTLKGTAKTEPKYSVLTQLKKAGFSTKQITVALTASYDEPTLFAGKPSGSSLEGYLYGDTYRFDIGTPATDVIKRALNEFSSKLKQYDLAKLYKKQHLTLYQGIILASMVQREVSETNAVVPNQDQRQVAQVFLTRLRKHMSLGSDVTFLYGAEQMGATPSPTLDSPYNTRLHKGLPPGPIATPGLSALRAVADPAATHYLFFVSGDNGKTYFSTTEQGHQQNIDAHCHVKCSL